MKSQKKHWWWWMTGCVKDFTEMEHETRERAVD
jgi:hypothetical protein